ncbi:DUF2358 domain-containing protein [Synechococcus sp. H55.2]|uniref:DUF2358 domain-containing protein n=1 Tax=unclassified Synechococcus TaxID=2626047 RepID=UPI0039C28F8B
MSHPSQPSLDLVAILRADYARFPRDQTYSIYDPQVYFRDPLNEFRGLDRYRAMIASLERWLQDIHLELHDIHQSGSHIRSEWTLRGSLSFLPWRPRLCIPGWTEMRLNPAGLIESHVDYWRCSRWKVMRQMFRPGDAKGSS